MSGHSKWSTIKHKKAKTDAQKGKVFTKIVREITTAARLGGMDPEANSRLRIAIMKAKEVNMPADNVKRAIQKGGAGSAEDHYDEVTFEGYAPDGVAILIETLTDNRNRTVPNIRSILSKAGGNLATKGAVAYQFEKQGLIFFENAMSEATDAILDLAITLGAEDVDIKDDGAIEITTTPENFEKIKLGLDEQNHIYTSASLEMVSQNKVVLNHDQAKKMLTLIEKLEDDDDIQAVYTNAQFPDDFSAE